MHESIGSIERQALMGQRARFARRKTQAKTERVRNLFIGGGLLATMAIVAVGFNGSKNEMDCVGTQTLTAPEGGTTPVELVQNNVAGNADAKNVVINVEMAGQGPTEAANAAAYIPEGVAVETPITCQA